MGPGDKLSGDKKDLIEAVIQLLNSSSWEEAHQRLVQHPELMSEETESLLGTSYQETLDEEARNIIQVYRGLLARCREVGIDRAFEEISGFAMDLSEDDVETLFEEIKRLNSPHDMPTKIRLLQRALSLDIYQNNLMLWAALHSELCNSLLKNPQRNQENIEDAIEHCNLALKMITQKDYPEDWAMIQHNLGLAYYSRITEDKVENIEQAIDHYNQALKVRTPKDYPVAWAATQVTLADAYVDRVRGNRAENIEEAIEHYNQALQMFLQKDLLNYWAAVQSSIADAYGDRIKGDKAKNIEKAIEHYNQALKVYTQKDYPWDWAITQYNLAIEYINRLRGDRAENIERVIDYCNQALKVLTQKDHSVNWASIQNCLGSAYYYRIGSGKAENLEKSIDHYNQALNVLTQKDHPVNWAMVQSNLATDYVFRVKGDKADNIEKAMEHCNQALEVYTQEKHPVDWAKAQNTLGLAYENRIRGDMAENIEHAIDHCNQSLKVLKQEDQPVDWAMVQHNLGGAYNFRIKGDRAENLEQAIKHYNQSLEVRTHKEHPVDWALTQNNLGFIYTIRICGDRADNIEKAIEHCNQAMKVYTQKDFPVEWAAIQDHLGIAYSDRIKGKRAKNIERAIKHHYQALKVYTQKDYPWDWAATQDNLATAYIYRVGGDRTENLKQAIKHYTQALKVRTQKDLPGNWATTQSNLATAYAVRAFDDRIRADRSQSIKQALKHFQNALRIVRLESSPNNFRYINRNLGGLYLHMERWNDAMESYKAAIEAGDYLYYSGLSAESKASEVKENAPLCQYAALVACHLGLIQEALLTLERGKTRLLSEALRLKMKRPDGIPENMWVKYKRAAEEYRSTITSAGLEKDFVERENRVQKALKELNTALKDLQMHAPRFQKGLEISDILTMLDEETALLAFCITDQGSIGFMISKSNGVYPVEVPGFKTKELSRLLFQTNEHRFINGGWVGDYLVYRAASNFYQQAYYAYGNEVDEEKKSKAKEQLLESQERFEDAFRSWQRTMKEVLSSIETSLFAPLLAELPPQIKKLILLPSGGLFLLPLHAIPLSDGQLLGQRYCISYAPSVSLLMGMKDKVKTTKGGGLYAVINPEEDPSLVFSRCEGLAISRFFKSPSPQVDEGYKCTKATVLDQMPGRAYLHFSCHGSYNWEYPPQSGLSLYGNHLHGDYKLSLAELQTDVVDLSSARLVTLSACETGMTDVVKGSAEEFIGLPAGFMMAGVPCVVSSLWSVPEISTALLMERFYSNHIGGMDIPSALQEAQLWVRDLNASQVADHVERCYRLGKWEGKSKEFIEMYRERYLKMAEEDLKMTKESPDRKPLKPFEHPYYWAAFTVNGA